MNRNNRIKDLLFHIEFVCAGFISIARRKFLFWQGLREPCGNEVNDECKYSSYAGKY